jgi:gas vesicle protein
MTAKQSARKAEIQKLLDSVQPKIMTAVDEFTAELQGALAPVFKRLEAMAEAAMQNA